MARGVAEFSPHQPDKARILHVSRVHCAKLVMMRHLRKVTVRAADGGFRTWHDQGAPWLGASAAPLLQPPPEAWSNPLLAAWGYNNICVGFDAVPMRYVAAIGWTLIIAFTFEYTRAVIGRIRIGDRAGLFKGKGRCARWADDLMIACHVFFFLCDEQASAGGAARFFPRSHGR